MKEEKKCTIQNKNKNKKKIYIWEGLKIKAKTQEII